MEDMAGGTRGACSAHVDSAGRKQRWQLVPSSLSPSFALSSTPACGTVLLTSDEAPVTSSNPHIPVQTHLEFVSMVTSHPTLTASVNLYGTSDVRAIAEIGIVEDSREIL